MVPIGSLCKCVRWNPQPHETSITFMEMSCTYFFFSSLCSTFFKKLFSNTVVSIFPPPLSPHLPTPTSHPPSVHLLALSMGPLYMFLDPSPFFPYCPLLPTPLVTVRLFLITMSLVIFYLLVCFVDSVPLIGEIIWYLSFTAWLISLSMMLSSSIYAVAKGGSSFLLSFCCVVFHCVSVLESFLLGLFCALSVKTQ